MIGDATDRGHYHAFIRRDGSRKLLILFSHLGRKPPSFAWYKLAANLEANLLFLNSEGQNWYRAGIPQLADTEGLPHTLDAIQKIAKRIGPNTQVYAAGASMGGYGALLYGSLINARGILACAAETILGLPGGRSAMLQPSRWSHIYPDLNVVAASKSKKHVIYGEMHLVDTLCASNVKGMANTNLVSVRSGDHGVSDTLAIRGELLPSLQSLIDDEDLLISSYGRGLADRSDNGDIWHLNWLIESKDFKNSADLALRISARIGDHPLVSYLTGLSFFHQRLDSDALVHFEKASKGAADFGPLWLYVGVTKSRNGHLAEGIAAIRKSISIDPKPSLSHYQLGLSLEAAGLVSDATDAFRKALLINPAHPTYIKKAAEFEPLPL